MYIRRWVKLVSRLDAPDQNRTFFLLPCARVDEIRLSSNLNLCSNSNTLNRRKKIWQVLCERFQSSTHTYSLHHVSLNLIVSELFAIVNQADCFPQENSSSFIEFDFFQFSWWKDDDEQSNWLLSSDLLRSLFMFSDEYSRIFTSTDVKRWKRSDYIRHSMNQNVYVFIRLYLKVNLRTTTTTIRPPLLASWCTCDLQKMMIDPLFTLTTCLKQALSSVMKWTRQLSVSFPSDVMPTYCVCLNKYLRQSSTFILFRFQRRGWEVNDHSILFIFLSWFESEEEEKKTINNFSFDCG